MVDTRCCNPGHDRESPARLFSSRVEPLSAISSSGSRLYQIHTLTGLHILRVGNLATAGLFWLSYFGRHKPEDKFQQVQAIGSLIKGLLYPDKLRAADQGSVPDPQIRRTRRDLERRFLVGHPLTELFE